MNIFDELQQKDRGRDGYIAPLSESVTFEMTGVLQESDGTGGVVPDPYNGGDD